MNWQTPFFVGSHCLYIVTYHGSYFSVIYHLSHMSSTSILLSAASAAVDQATAAMGLYRKSRVMHPESDLENPPRPGNVFSVF